MEYDSAAKVWVLGQGDKAYLLDGPDLHLTAIKIQLVTPKWIYWWVTDRANPHRKLGERGRTAKSENLIVPRAEAWVHDGKIQYDAPPYVVR